MSAKLEALCQNLQNVLGDRIAGLKTLLGEVTLEVAAGHYLETARILRVALSRLVDAGAESQPALTSALDLCRALKLLPLAEPEAGSKATAVVPTAQGQREKLLLAAIWLGFMIANQLVRPIGDLITAAERVGTGELNVRVNPRRADDELGSLARSFNRMTAQLARNREQLIEANRQLDARREFTETVLSGVSAGVIGLDSQDRITLVSRAAEQLLAIQAGVYRYTQEVELASKVVDRVTNGVKTVLQSQQ